MNKEQFKEALEQVLKTNPDLGQNGFRQPRDTDEKHEEYRQIDDEFLLEFVLCTEWLRRTKSRKTINKVVTSYGIKHMAESDVGHYVSNGALLCAAIFLRVDLARDWRLGPNAWLAISIPKRWSNQDFEALSKKIQLLWQDYEPHTDLRSIRRLR